MAITVSLVEDEQPVRASMQELIQRTPGMEFHSGFPSAEEAIPALEKAPPQVLLVDISLKGGIMNGIEMVRHLSPKLDGTEIMMLTALQDPDNIFAALEAGATGYMLKRSSGPEVIEAIEELMRGGAPMSSDVARLVVQSFNRTKNVNLQNALSTREQEVLDLLAKGFAYKEIASRLHLSYHTIHTHVRNVYSKLHARTRFEALKKAGKLPFQ